MFRHCMLVLNFSTRCFPETQRPHGPTPPSTEVWEVLWSLRCVERQAVVFKLLPHPEGWCVWGLSGGCDNEDHLVSISQTTLDQWRETRWQANDRHQLRHQCLTALFELVFQQIKSMLIKYTILSDVAKETFLLFSSPWRLSSKVIEPEIQRERDVEDEIDFEQLWWEELSKHKRLLHSCSLLSVLLVIFLRIARHTLHCQCRTLASSYEPKLVL